MISLSLWPPYRRRERERERERERPSVPTAQEAARGQKLIFEFWIKDKSLFAPAGIRTMISPTSVPKPSHYSDYYIGASTQIFYSVPNQAVMCVMYFFLERYIYSLPAIQFRTRMPLLLVINFTFGGCCLPGIAGEFGLVSRDCIRRRDPNQ
jgi:hypothetical protein